MNVNKSSHKKAAVAQASLSPITEGAAIDDLSHALLMRLIQSWEQSARSQFQCAQRTIDPMGKRLVEHGGMCYHNCAADLRRALGAELPQPLPTPIKR